MSHWPRVEQCLGIDSLWLFCGLRMSRLPLLHLTKGLRMSPSKTLHHSSINKTVLKSRNLTKLTLSHETDHQIESSKLLKIVIISKSSRFGRRRSAWVSVTKMAWKTASPPKKNSWTNVKTTGIGRFQQKTGKILYIKSQPPPFSAWTFPCLASCWALETRKPNMKVQDVFLLFWGGERKSYVFLSRFFHWK